MRSSRSDECIKELGAVPIPTSFKITTDGQLLLPDREEWASLKQSVAKLTACAPKEFMTADVMLAAKAALENAKQSLLDGYTETISAQIVSFTDKLEACFTDSHLLTQALRTGQSIIANLPDYKDIGLDALCDENDNTVKLYKQTSAKFTADINMLADMTSDVLGKRVILSDSKDQLYSDFKKFHSDIPLKGIVGFVNNLFTRVAAKVIAIKLVLVVFFNYTYK